MSFGHPRDLKSLGSIRIWIWVAAVALPIAVALLLVPSRGHLSAADDALVLVVATVAIASWGNRAAAALAALVAAASFDYLLTRPYGSFRISRQADLTTEILFVTVGLLVGELAARGRRYQQAAARGRLDLSANPRPWGSASRAERTRTSC